MVLKNCKCYKNAVFISLVFLIFGIAWIILSDYAVATFTNNAQEMTQLQTYKGWFFIFLTTLFLFFLTYRFFKSIHMKHMKNLKIFTLHYQAKKNLKKSKEKISEYNILLNTIVNSSPDAIFAKDINGKFLLFNQATANLINVDAKSVIGMDDYTIFKPEIAKALQDMDKKIIAEKKIITFEEKTVAKDGAEIIFLATKGPLLDNHGKAFGVFGISRDITAQKEYEKFLIESKEKFYKMSHIDSVTSLPNRLYISEILTKKCDEGLPFCLILLDLDEFKLVNDSYGHRFGDNLLFEVSIAIQKLLDSTSFIGRMGGDEFGIILNTNDKEEIESLLQKIHNKFSNPFTIDTTNVYITASSGVCIYPDDAKSMGEIYQAADTAMYNAKKLGKNKFSFYDLQFKKEAISHTKIVTNLKQAISLNELELYFQPQYNPKTEQIIGAEALLRWQHNSKMIAPDIFIPLAEKSGLIVEIGNFVLEKGFETAKYWYDKGLLKERLAINISARQLTHIEFLNTLKNILDKTNCSASYIELEITESLILENPTLCIEILEKLKKLGFYISMDDFGTGYSSLSYLKNLPIDKLKIDRSFITNINNESKNQVIVKTIIFLAKELGINILAEGVETKDELEFLMKHNIDSIQGYYFAKPMRIEDIEKLLLKNC